VAVQDLTRELPRTPFPDERGPAEAGPLAESTIREA
jgi:hypothetical protein